MFSQFAAGFSKQNNGVLYYKFMHRYINQVHRYNFMFSRSKRKHIPCNEQSVLPGFHFMNHPHYLLSVISCPCVIFPFHSQFQL